jgi:hypothetical protein
VSAQHNNSLTIDNDIDDSFVPASPTCFRIGDIVEVQMTVSAVSVKNNKFKMILNLRSLALVNSEFTEVPDISNNSMNNN